MGPIDYSINVESPMAAFGQGANVGAVFSDLQNKLLAAQQAREQQKIILQKKQELLSKENRTAQDYTDLALLLPKEEGDNVRSSWDTFSKERQEKELQFGGEVMSAFHAGSPDVAIQLLQERAQAARNSGNEGEAASYETYAKLAQSNPSAAQTVIGTMIGAVPGGDKVLENTIKTLKAPSDIRQSEASATKAEYEAQDTPERLALNNEKTSSDIKSADLKRKLDSLDIQIKQSNSETDKQRLQLERDKFASELQLKTQEQQQNAQNQLDTVNNSLNTVNSLLKHPLWESAKGLIGTGVGSTVGKWLGAVPGTQNKDFDMLLDTVKSQQFLTQVQTMRGLGSLSNAEGERVERAIASLSRDQSPEALKTALNVIKTTLERAQAKIIASGKLSQNGGAFVMQHPIFGNISDGKINALLQKNPGATRQQIIDYLTQTGGK